MTATKKHLVIDTDRFGNQRVYVRIKGRPKIRIRHQIGTAAFESAYKRAVEGEKAFDIPVKPGAPHADDGESFVYVMSDGRTTKVGISIRPEDRLKDVACGNCLIRIHALFSVSARNARQLERASHRLLAGQHISGEWFRAPPADAAVAVGRAAAELRIATREVAVSETKVSHLL